MRWAWLLLLSSAGCDSCLAKRPPDPALPASSVAASSVAAIDATPPARAVATVSLVPWTESRVAVSSTVDNPKDYPEHLIDGKLDTAWNGRTGDLGGFIAFRVPRAAHVASVQLTVGFDKKDLFAANHRISRVKIIRDGTVLREVALDVEKRGLQSISVDQPGGDFELRVIETVPGTNAKWKELVVSEFVVLGDPGTARRASPHLPRVRVGSLDAPESRFVPDADAATEPGNGPWPSIDSYCAAFRDRAAEKARKKDPTHPCAEIPPPRCGLETPVPYGSPPFDRSGILSISDGFVRERWVAIETTAGWWPRMISFDGADECQMGDFATTTSELKSSKPIGPAALAFEIETRTIDPMYSDPDTGAPSMWVKEDGERILHVCRLLAAGLRCDERHVLGTYSGRLGDRPTPFESWSGRRAWRADPVDGGTILLR